MFWGMPFCRNFGVSECYISGAGTHISWVVFRRADPDQNMAQRLNFFATMAPDGLFGDVILSQRESAVWVTPSRISSR